MTAQIATRATQPRTPVGSILATLAIVFVITLAITLFVAAGTVGPVQATAAVAATLTGLLMLTAIWWPQWHLDRSHRVVQPVHTLHVDEAPVLIGQVDRSLTTPDEPSETLGDWKPPTHDVGNVVSINRSA